MNQNKGNPRRRKFLSRILIRRRTAYQFHFFASFYYCLSSSTYQPVSFGCILLGQVRVRRRETRKRHNNLKDRTAQEGLIYGGQPASPQEEGEEREEDITSYLLRDFVFHIFSLSVAAQDDLSEEATRQQQPLRKHKHYPSCSLLSSSSAAAAGDKDDHDDDGDLN